MPILVVKLLGEEASSALLLRLVLLELAPSSPVLVRLALLELAPSSPVLVRLALLELDTCGDLSEPTLGRLTTVVAVVLALEAESTFASFSVAAAAASST